MKKLLITAIAAAGMTVGLHAEDYFAGTDFEDGGVPTSSAWTLPEDSGRELSNVADTYTLPEIGAPEQWTAHTKYLKAKTTFGKPITLNANHAIDGVYFDSLVKFTVCDKDDTVQQYDDAKIIVWAQANNEDGTAADYWVRANIPSGDGYVSHDFKCDAVTGIDAWHRLTIKAIGNIKAGSTGLDAVPGFVVYVDGVALAYAAAEKPTLEGLTPNAGQFHEFRQLFISLVQGEAVGKDTISGVAFDGQGFLDDLTLTETPPSFAEDYEFFTITMGEHVTGFTYKVDSEDPVEKKADVQLPYTSGMTVTISDVTCDDGYMYKELTGDTASGNVFTPTAKDQTGTIVAQAAAASFNGENYAMIAKAAEAANAITTAGDYTLKLWNDCTTGGLDINNETEGVNIIIDLAGKTITGTTDDTAAIMVTAGNVMITNSNETVEGTVNSGDASYAVGGTGDNLKITAGKYNGNVYLDGITSAVITGGKFDDVNNDEQTLKGYLADGLTVTDDNGYYVVSEKPYEGPEKDKDGAYLIKTEQDLVWVAEHFATYQNAKLIQQNDIAMTAAFPGIGDAAKPLVGDGATNKKFNDVAFLGTYDGNNKKITNFKLTKLAPGWGDIPKTGEKISEYSASMDHEYGGFINSAGNGAIVKDLTIELGDNGGWGTETASAFGGAAFVGTARGATLQNLKTAGTNGFSGANKAMAGIVGFAAADTLVKDCENNIAINTTNEKGGGIAAITQASSAEHPATFDGCKNTGDITGASKASGINAYVDTATVIRNCENTGAAAYAIAYQNNANLTVEGTNKGQASLPATNTAVDGLNFATIDDNVATYVANATVAQGGTYKVMVATAPAITLADGKTLTLDKAATVTAATPADYYIATSGTYTYTSTAKTTPTITVTLNPDTVEYTAGMSFPTPQVTGADTYDTSWAPTAITEPAAGATNEYVVTISVAATETTKAAQGQATLKVYKSAGPVYPQDLPDDPTVKAKYADWAKGKTIDDPNAPEVMEAFLLNCELSEVETEKAKFKIVSITQDANGDWIVKVTGEKGDGAEYGNGFVEIVPYEGIDVGDNGELFQAKLVPQLSTKGE